MCFTLDDEGKGSISFTVLGFLQCHCPRVFELYAPCKKPGRDEPEMSRRGGGEPGRIVHLNFEDERIKSVSVDELHLIAEAHAELFPEFARAKCWYFLDELQNVEGWETYALKR